MNSSPQANLHAAMSVLCANSKVLQEGDATHLMAPFGLRSLTASLAAIFFTKEKTALVLQVQRFARQRDQSPAAAAQARVYPKQARPHIREALSALVTRMDFLFRRILHGHFSDAVRQVAGRMRPKQFLNVPAYYAGTVRPDLIVNGTNAETLSLVGLTLLTDHIISDMSMTGDPGTPAEYAQRILTSARDMNPELFHAA